MRTPDGARVEIDNWNEQQVVERRKAGVESLLEEAARARRELTGHLKALTEEDLTRTLKFTADSKRAAAEIPLGAYLREARAGPTRCMQSICARPCPTGSRGTGAVVPMIPSSRATSGR